MLRLQPVDDPVRDRAPKIQRLHFAEDDSEGTRLDLRITIDERSLRFHGVGE